MVVGNRRSHATEHVLRVMDGLAWLAQAGMFVVLGLLVTPSKMIDHATEALAMAVFLTLVARPLAVAIGLLRLPLSARAALRELGGPARCGAGGAGDRAGGDGRARSQLLFNVALRWCCCPCWFRARPCRWRRAGWGGGAAARRTAMTSARSGWAMRRVVDMLEFCVEAGAKADGRHPDELRRRPSRPRRALRGPGARGRPALPDPDTRLRPGDSVWMIAPDEISGAALRAASPAVAASSPPTPASSGEFVVDPDSRASDLADAYGLRIAEAERELAMGELLAVRLGRPPVVGDRVDRRLRAHGARDGRQGPHHRPRPRVRRLAQGVEW